MATWTTPKSPTSHESDCVESYTKELPVTPLAVEGTADDELEEFDALRAVVGLEVTMLLLLATREMS